jgi:hypothetical protein
MRGNWIAAACVSALLIGVTPAYPRGLLGNVVNVSKDGVDVNLGGAGSVSVGGNTNKGVSVDVDVLDDVGGGVDASVDLGGGSHGSHGQHGGTNHGGGHGNIIDVDADVLDDVGGGVQTGVSVGHDRNGGLDVDAGVDALPGVGGGIDTDVSVGVGHGGHGGSGIGLDTDIDILPGVGGGIGADVDINVGGGGGTGGDIDVCILGGCGSPNGPNPPHGPNGPHQPNLPVPDPIWDNVRPQLPPTPPSARPGSNHVGMIDRIIRNRGWSMFLQGNALCLPRLRIALVQGWLPDSDIAGLRTLLGYHEGEIARIRALLAACPTNRLSRADLSRVLGIDVLADGTPVVFMF